MLRENVSRLDWCLSRTITLWFLGTKPKRYSHYPISSWGHDFASHFLGKRKLSFALEGRLTLKNKRGWDKSPSLSIVFGLSIKTQWLSGLYYADFISFYNPTQLCGGGTTKSNSNELPISVPLSLFRSLDKVIWKHSSKLSHRAFSDWFFLYCLKYGTIKAWEFNNYTILSKL